MLLFNKFAVQDFPLECCLVWAQLFFAASCLSLFAFPYIHVGSARDLLRWCMVVPFYCGMLLTSILALKTAPMSLVIVLRNTSPLGTLVIERFYPEPLRISSFMLGSIFLMIGGEQLPSCSFVGSGYWRGGCYQVAKRGWGPMTFKSSQAQRMARSHEIPSC